MDSWRRDRVQELKDDPWREGWQPSLRYPDPAVEVLDDAFLKYRLPLASVERLATGFRWAEGPVYFADHRCLLWSDIPNNRIMRWDEMTGTVTTFRQPSGMANGHTRDRQGRLISCEHLNRRVTRTELDGSLTVIADNYQGKKLNSPNDVVVTRDGSIWFTDPNFGLLSFYEGHKAKQELPQNVYRVDPNGRLTIVIKDVLGPNGLAFSPKENILYLVESRAQPHRLISAFDVKGGKVTNRRVLIDAGPGGTPDGFRVDIDGNLWCGWGMNPDLDGVRIFTPKGKPIGHIHLPERCANVCFGGVNRDRLFMASSHSLYALYTNAQGVAGG